MQLITSIFLRSAKLLEFTEWFISMIIGQKTKLKWTLQSLDDSLKNSRSNVIKN